MRRRPAFASRLPRWHEASLYFGVVLLTGSGAGWLLLHDRVTVQGPFGPQPSAVEHPLLIVHGVVAAAFLIAGGALIPVHVRLGLAGRRNRGSGIATGTVMALLAATGAALYYAGDEVLRAGVSTAHWVLGLAAALLFGWHAVAGRRR